MLAILLFVHFSSGLRLLRPPKISFGDGIEYINAAFHLHQDLIYKSAPERGATPAVGREPGYPVSLALLMSLDPDLATSDPTCSGLDTACDAQRLRCLAIANLLLLELAALLLFALALATALACAPLIDRLRGRMAGRPSGVPADRPVKTPRPLPHCGP